jgi:hypothetical protein
MKLGIYQCHCNAHYRIEIVADDEAVGFVLARQKCPEFRGWSPVVEWKLTAEQASAAVNELEWFIERNL